MKHMANQHFMLGVSLRTSRPDFQLFQHLWQKKLIDDRDLKELKGGEHLLTQKPSASVATRRNRRGGLIRTDENIPTTPRSDPVESPVNMSIDEDYLWGARANAAREDLVGSRQRLPIMQIDSVLNDLPSAESVTAPTDTQFDSGYGSISVAALETNDEDDASSVRSIITNASRVSLPPQEKKHLVSAFTGDLCQDINFSGYRTDARNRILSRFPELLKNFSLRLEGSVKSKAERDAKEFLRQQRK